MEVKLESIRNVKIKIRLKLKISGWTRKQSPTNLECSCVEINCLVVFQTNLLLLRIPSLNRAFNFRLSFP